MRPYLVNKKVLFISVALIAYYVIMEFYYLYFIGVFYEVYGFKIELNSLKYIETKLLFTIVLGFSIYLSRTSEFIYSIFILFTIFFLVPALTIYSFSNQSPAPLYSIFALVMVLGLVSSLKINIPYIEYTPVSYGVIILLLILFLSPFVFRFGIYFNGSNFLLENISETRDFFEKQSSPVINYFYNWLVKAIVPIFLVFFLIRKQRTYAILSVLILIYLYIISGNKLVYISLFVMLFFSFVGKTYFEKMKYLLIALIVGLLILPLVDFYIINGHNLKGIFVMRMLFLPSQLNYYYFDFFSDHHLYFAESNLFKMFTEYPYDKPIGFIIAQTYFNTSEMNANNGIIGDGFMNLGYWGIALNISIVALIFLFFNSVDADPRYLGIFFVMIFLFLSVPMLSMFITSGLWIIFIMALTIMRRKANINT